jgi:hypothetical protein
MTTPAPTQVPIPGFDPPKPTVRRAVVPRGLIRVADLARARGREPRTLRRWLVKADKRLGGTLLVQLTEGGQYYVRMNVLEARLPDLATPAVVDEEEPGTGPLDAAWGLAAEVRELRESVAQLTDQVQEIRSFLVLR